jgi:histidinol dehydrogenase
MSLQIRRIICAEHDALQALAEVRRQLSQDGELVSERGKALTLRVFGEPLSPQRSVERICRDVRERGFAAVQRYSQALDNFELTPDNLRVRPEEIAAAHRRCDPAFLQAVRRVQKAVLAFQVGILHRDAVWQEAPGQEIRLRYRPVRRVGVCVPGGAAAYPSTLLMTVCPARAAGVPEIAVVAPPTPFGANNPDLLAVCKELGVQEVYRIGGAQAVAALAYGIEGLPRVDMIVGPGNLFVTLAKRYVYGQVGIDLLAGPSEVVVLADSTARPDYVASDLLAQAEHAPGASLLLSWEPGLLDAVAEALEEQLERLPRSELVRESLEAFGALILTRDAAEAIELTNALAPEHVHLCTAAPERLAEQIANAGAIFLGHHSPVAVGDYAAGPSHVLPTGGTARFASGLSANDFLRRTSILRFNRQALQAKADDVRQFAAKEGLLAHQYSVEVRLQAEAQAAVGC